MRFSINKADAVKAIGIAASVANASSVGMLRNVEIKASDGVVTFSSTSQDTSVNTSVSGEQVDIMEDGTVSVNATALVQSIAACNKSKISITLDDGSLRISGGRTSKLPAVSGFSGVIDHDYSSAFTFNVTSDNIRAVARACGSAASIDHSRPHMSGIMMDINGTEVVAYATDGHRVHICNNVAQSDTWGDGAILMNDAMFASIAKETTSETVAITPANDYVRISINDGTVTYHVRLVERAMRHEQIKGITDRIETVSWIDVDRRHVMGEIKGISHALSSQSKAVVFSFNDNVRSISARGNDISSETSFDCDASDGVVVIGMNGKYLSDALASFDSTNVRMSFGDDKLKPCIVTSIDDPSVYIVVMPTRL